MIYLNMEPNSSKKMDQNEAFEDVLKQHLLQYFAVSFNLFNFFNLIYNFARLTFILFWSKYIKFTGFRTEEPHYSILASKGYILVRSNAWWWSTG